MMRHDITWIIGALVFFSNVFCLSVGAHAQSSCNYTSWTAFDRSEGDKPLEERKQWFDLCQGHVDELVQDSVGYFLMRSYRTAGNNAIARQLALDILPLSPDHEEAFYFYYHDYSGYIFRSTKDLKAQLRAWNTALKYADAVHPNRALYLRNSIAVARSSLDPPEDIHREFLYLEQAIQPLLEDALGEPNLRPTHTYILLSLVASYSALPLEAGETHEERAEIVRAYAKKTLEAAQHPDSPGMTISALDDVITAYYGINDWEAYEASVDKLKRYLNRQTFGSNSMTTAYRHLGLLSLRQGNYNQAISEFGKALDFAYQGGIRYNTIRSLLFLGNAYELDEKPLDALAAYTKAVATIDSSLNEIGTMEWGKGPSSVWSRPYLGKMRQHLRLGDIENAYLALADRSGRYLLTQHIQKTRPYSKTVASRIDSLYRRLSTVRTELLTEPEVALEQGLPIEEKSLQAEIEELKTVGAPPRLDLPALQRHLSSTGQTLVHFVFPDAYDTRGPYYADRPTAKRGAFIVSADTLAFVELAVGPQDVARFIEATSSVFVNHDSPGSAQPNHFNLSGLADLYDQLIRPIEPWLANSKRLVIIPDGQTHRVPFATLVSDYTHDFSYETADFLIERFSITYSVIPHLYLYNDLIDTSSLSDDIAFFGVEKGYASPDGSFQLAPLEGVRPERNAIAKEVRNLSSHVGSTAKPSTLLSKGLAASVLHIAAHARPNLDNPLWSQIFLEPDTTYPSGILHLYDLEGQATATQLLILSACDSRQGVISDSEGMLGFHHAFHSIGIPSTIATLWEMDDEAASQLFSSLYAPLAEDQPKDVALQQTILTYLEGASPLQKSPYYWGGVVLTGATNPIAVHAATPRGLWTGLLLLMGVLVGIRSFFRHRTTSYS
ncbi:MAG: CHAT domain-containing tetratricopeptide repeat protein [Bacteroidota bacterium]